MMECVMKLEKKGNRHIGHCTHTTGSTNVKEQKIFHRRNNLTCSTNRTGTTAAAFYSLETRFVSVIYL
jgi:hypothetical protein